MRNPSFVLLALLVAACASPTPQLDQRFGNAVREARVQQTLDPQAATKARPAATVDGVAADESVHRFRESFKAPQPTFVIIGAPPGGGGAR